MTEYKHIVTVEFITNNLCKFDLSVPNVLRAHLPGVIKQVMLTSYETAVVKPEPAKYQVWRQQDREYEVLAIHDSDKRHYWLGELGRKEPFYGTYTKDVFDRMEFVR